MLRWLYNGPIETKHEKIKMKASAMFDTVQDLAKFMAKPQAVVYTTGDAYEFLGSYWVDFSIEPFITVEQMKERVWSFQGTLILSE